MFHSFLVVSIFNCRLIIWERKIKKTIFLKNEMKEMRKIVKEQTFGVWVCVCAFFSSFRL